MERGPDPLGIAHRMNLIVAGRDVFSCDLVGAMVMGMKPEEIEYLRDYASIKERSFSLDGIEVRGESIDEVTRKLEWPFSFEDIFHQSRISGLTIQEPGQSSCSGCETILSAFSAVFSKDNPDAVLDGVEVCMGNEVRAKKGSKKVFLLGNCAIAANRDLMDGTKIKGCPPPVFNAVMALVLKSLPPQRVAKILMSRMIKNLRIKMGIYDEVFPVYGTYNTPEFDRSHF